MFVEKARAQEGNPSKKVMQIYFQQLTGEGYSGTRSPKEPILPLLKFKKYENYQWRHFVVKTQIIRVLALFQILQHFRQYGTVAPFVD